MYVRSSLGKQRSRSRGKILRASRGLGEGQDQIAARVSGARGHGILRRRKIRS